MTAVHNRTICPVYYQAVQKPSVEKITTEQAEKLLKGQQAYTYLLRNSDKTSQFYLSFVRLNLAVCHELFVQVGGKYLRFRNGDVHSLEGSIQDTEAVTMLAQEIMTHCSHSDKHSSA